MRCYLKKILLIILFTLVVPSLFSRDIAIFVKDHDLDIPLEGALVRTRDGIEYTTDENGKTTIQAPDNRQTVIRASYPGYETGTLTIPVTGDSFIITLHLSGILQGRELVIEAARPGASETRTGRSIAVSSREISQTAEIGVIEDVLNTIKLLPGVSYMGFFNSQPSIRGGHPGDMSASLNGFYINYPYHWGGAYSIFDPRMVQSAQLSHGVFSSRWGHTISGLLEVTAKNPSPTETQIEVGINTSTAFFNISIPFSGRGGILFMSRVTYYDPVIELAKKLSDSVPELAVVNYITTAPYIRSAAISSNYRFTGDIEIFATAFFGMDGVGVNYLNSSENASQMSSMKLNFINYQSFITSTLSWNPRNDMLLKLTTGAGYENTITDGRITYRIGNMKFSDDFIYRYDLPGIDDVYNFTDISLIEQSEILFNLQGRIDFDWKLSNYFLVSAGIQEMINWYSTSGNQKMISDVWFRNLDESEQLFIKSLYFTEIPSSSNVWNHLRVSTPVHYSPNATNNLFSTSAYILTEYTSGNSRLNAELGLRADHFYLQGNGFNAGSEPVLNPRLNIDYNILKNAGFLQSLDISAGTGLFSSINANVFLAEKRYEINKIKPNRSWTSVLGIRLELPESLSLNIEAYYKYVFDRMYIPVAIGLEELDIKPKFDGEGIVWGIDVMLHKVYSRFWDGWLSYSYLWSKYRDPQGRYGGLGMSGGDQGRDWYFPGYHRFHNLNLVLNIKPQPKLNFYFRFGLASGVPLLRRLGDKPENYPVLVYDKENPDDSYFIEKYHWTSVYDESNRTTPSLPLDFKFSVFGSKGKSRYEIYFALENILALVYSAEGNRTFNPYTGQIDSGSNIARYDIPIPIPSFGFKISY